MSNPSDFPLALNNRAWNLVTLPGARHLNTAEVLSLAETVRSQLFPLFQQGLQFTSKVVPCERDLVGAAAKEDDTYVMYLGLGLEVIQALQDAEKPR